MCVAVRVRGDELVHADSPIPTRSLVRRPVLHRLAPSVLAGALVLFGASACVPNPEPVALDVERLELEPSSSQTLPYVVMPDSDPLDAGCIGGASCQKEATDEDPKHAEKARERRKRTRRKHPPKPTEEEQMMGFLL